MHRRVPPARVVALALLALSPLVASACRGPTQIDLRLSTDLSCAEIDTVSIHVGAPGTLDPNAPQAEIDRTACTAPSLGNMVVVPSGARDARLAFEVVLRTKPGIACVVDAQGKLPDTCLVARRRLGFVPHTPLVMPVQLDRQCLGVPCSADRTCVRGLCVDALLPNPEQCADLQACAGDGGAGDGGAADSGTPDGGPAPTLASLSSRANHTCALVAGGAVRCWGYGTDGQLGNNMQPMRQSTPVDVVGLTGARTVATGYVGLP
jgi:hypothetical protein